MNKQPPTLKLAHKQIIASKHLVWLAVIAISVLTGGAMMVANPLFIVGGIFGLMAAVALFVNPFLGVLAYLVFEYSSLSEMYPILAGLQLGKVIVLTTMAAWAIKGLFRRNLEFVSDRLNWWFLVWVLVALSSILVAAEARSAIQGTINIVKWFIIYIMIINIVDTLPKWKWSVWVLLLLAFKMSQFQIRMFNSALSTTSDAEYLIKEGLGAGTTAFFGNAGDFGVFMCVMAPLAFYLIMAVDRKILKAIGILFLAFFVASVFRSGARGNTLALFGMASAYWFRSRHKLLIGAVIVMAATFFWVNAPDIVRERFRSATADQKDATASARLKLWGAGVHMLFTNPVVGVGVNNFSHTWLDKYADPVDAGGATAPHNIFIQCMAELGFPGIISMLTIIYLMFMRNRQMRAMMRLNQCRNKWITNFSLGLDMSLVGYIVAGSFLSVLYYPYLFLLLALIVSLHNITTKRVEAGLDRIPNPDQSVPALKIRPGDTPSGKLDRP